LINPSQGVIAASGAYYASPATRMTAACPLRIIVRSRIGDSLQNEALTMLWVTGTLYCRVQQGNAASMVSPRCTRARGGAVMPGTFRDLMNVSPKTGTGLDDKLDEVN
jgi:hypothetical protein